MPPILRLGGPQNRRGRAIVEGFTPRCTQRASDERHAPSMRCIGFLTLPGKSTEITVPRCRALA
jgi:hypothetical protein